jgi:hypothetical protein
MSFAQRFFTAVGGAVPSSREGLAAGANSRGARAPRLPWVLAVTALVSFAGCMSPSFDDPARLGPFFTPLNHVGEPSLGGMRRVVVLPVCGGTLAPVETVAALDPVIVAALQQQHRFEVVSLTRDQARRRFHVEEFSSVGALPHDFLGIIQREFAADGVLFVDITVFRPYRPIGLGLRAKLATLDGSARLIWSFDNVFSADDPAVANSARAHFLGSDRGGVPADLSPGVLQSPARFAGYAADAMFATLPPVVAAPVAPARP